MAFTEVEPGIWIDRAVSGESIQRIVMNDPQQGQVAALRADYLPVWIPMQEARALIAGLVVASEGVS